MFRRLIFFVLLSLLFLGVTVLAKAQAAVAKGGGLRVVCVVSSYQKAYLEAKDGLLSRIRREGVIDQRPIEILSVINLGDSREKASVVEKLKKIRPDLIFTFGTPATRMVLESMPRVPLVYTMVTEAPSSSVGAISGVVLRVPESTELKFFFRVTGLRKIGVICGEGFDIDPSLHKVAKALGVDVHVLRLKEGVTLETALKQLKHEGYKGLLMVPDVRVYDSLETIRFVLSWSLKKGILVFGLSPEYCSHGAAMALRLDYGAMGEKAFDVAGKLLSSVVRHPLPPLHPTTYGIVVNKGVLERMGIKIPSHVSGRPVIEVR